MTQTGVGGHGGAKHTQLVHECQRLLRDKYRLQAALHFQNRYVEVLQDELRELCGFKDDDIDKIRSRVAAEFKD